MKPVCPNRYETLPLEELLVDLYFHDGVATVRDNEMLPEFCPSRTLFNAVELRMGELRAEGYRALAFINVGMIRIYAPDRRRDYYIDKYGVSAPVMAIIIVFLAFVAALWGL